MKIGTRILGGLVFVAIFGGLLVTDYTPYSSCRQHFNRFESSEHLSDLPPGFEDLVKPEKTELENPPLSPQYIRARDSWHIAQCWFAAIDAIALLSLAVGGVLFLVLRNGLVPVVIGGVVKGLIPIAHVIVSPLLDGFGLPSVRLFYYELIRSYARHPDSIVAILTTIVVIVLVKMIGSGNRAA